MSTLFTNLVLRNGDAPSSSILQPRLPSLFESPNQLEGLPETTSDQAWTRPLPQSPEKTSFSQQVETIHASVSVSTPNDKPPIEPFQDDQKFNSGPTTSNPFSFHGHQEQAHSRDIQDAVETEGDNYSILSSDSYRAETIMSQEKYSNVTNQHMGDQRTDADPEQRFVKPRVKLINPPDDNAHQIETKKPAAFGNLHSSPNVFHPLENTVGVEPPIIQIHIGRIEVRAIMTPPAPPVAKAAPAQPRMTLDDYLRQREGRR